jgi:hypothetical protein
MGCILYCTSVHPYLLWSKNPAVWGICAAPVNCTTYRGILAGYSGVRGTGGLPAGCTGCIFFRPGCLHISGVFFFFIMYFGYLLHPPPPLCELARPAEWGFVYMVITGQQQKKKVFYCITMLR